MSVNDYTPLFEKYGAQHNVDPALLAAIATQESAGNPNAVSPQGALGLMQIMPRTAKNLGVDPHDPEQAVEGAARLLSESLDRNGNVEDAVTEYHGGPNRKLWGPKTRKYRSEVMARYAGGSSDGASGADTMEGSAGGDLLSAAMGEPPPSGSKSSSTDDLLNAAMGAPKTTPAPAASQASAPTATGADALMNAAAPQSGIDMPALADPNNTRVRGTGIRINNAQQETLDQMVHGHLHDPDAPEGSAKHPYFLYGGKTPEDLAPGSFFINYDGTLGKVPAEGDKSAPVKGFGQGIGDVMLSLGHAVDPNSTSELTNDLTARQMAYDAEHKGDLISGAGRFTGQMAGTIPLMMGAEAAAAPVLANSGAVGAFLAGKGGQTALDASAPLINKLIQGGIKTGSQAALGAREGALASGLVSSANDQPLGEQLKTGALLGGVLAPAGSAITSGVRRFVAPEVRGAAAPLEQKTQIEMSQGLPVPVPMTTGQVTGAPAQQLEENALLKGVHGDAAAKIMQTQRDEAQAALRGNVETIGNQIAGKPLQPGEASTAVSEKLNAMRDDAKKSVNAAYDQARASGNDAMLSSAHDLRESILTGLRSDYDLEGIPRVAKEVENLGSKGAPTVGDLLDARARLSGLRASGDGVEAGAAGKAVRAMDAGIDAALQNDLLIGDKGAVTAWRDALKARSDYGKLFEGKDLISGLVEQVRHGEGMANKIDPAEAANYILGRSDLGFVGKKDLHRDLVRMRDVLGPDSDEWNGLRSEIFGRVARGGEGPAELAQGQFSGQKFFNAWSKAKRENPQIVNTVFTPEERNLIDRFADVAQRVTTPVKGGDNPSGSAFAGAILIKKALQNIGSMSGGSLGALSGSAFGPGGTAAGGAMGAGVGRAFDAFMHDIGSVLKARKAVTPKIPKMAQPPGPVTKLLPAPGPALGAVMGNKLLSAPAPQVDQPQP